MKEKLIKFVVGKNLPHLARVACTFIGSALLATAVFSPEAAPLDAGVGEVIEQVPVPSAEGVRDGLTVGETVASVVGLLALWASRLMSWLRARNYDWAARIAGPLIGRSLPSFFRFLLVAAAGLLARLTAQPELAPEALANMPLATALGAIGAVLLANWSSATEDAERNPVTR